MARFFSFLTTRHSTSVLTLVILFALSMAAVGTFAGCTLPTKDRPAGNASGGLWDRAFDAGARASRKLALFGAGAIPVNPLIGSILAGVGVAGTFACDAVRQRRRVRKLSQPWDLKERRRRPREPWTDVKRHQYRVANEPQPGAPNVST